MSRSAKDANVRPPKRAKGEIQTWSPRCTERFFPMRVPVAESLRTFHITQAGRCILYPGYFLQRPASVYHLVLYTISGAGQITAEGRNHAIQAGSLMLAPAEAAYEYKPVRPRWRFVWFHLDNAPGWAHLQDRGLGVRPTLSTAQVSEAAQGYIREASSNRASSVRAARLYAELVTILLERDLRPGTPQASVQFEEQLHALWDTICDDLRHKWTVAELAAQLHLSVPHFHRLVKAHEGISPIQMLTRLRMMRAQELLSGYGLSIREVAENVGYENEFAFSTAFKRFAGLPPRRFRTRFG